MLFHANSVYLYFRPVYLVSKVFGVMPLSLTLGTNPRLESSRLSFFYSVLSLLITTGHAFSTPWFVSGDSKTASTLVTIDVNTGNASKYVSFLRNQTSVQMVALRMMNPLIVSYMSLGAQVVTVIYVRKLLPNFLSNLSKIDDLLNSIVWSRPAVDFRTSLFITLYFAVVSVPLSAFYLIHSFIEIQGWDFIWNLILNIEDLISFLLEVQFMNLGAFLYSRFRSINICLEKHIQGPPSKYCCVYKKSATSSKTLTVVKLEVLHHSCRGLSELIRDLNDIYQVNILCSLSGSFVKILLNIYFAIFTSRANIIHSIKIAMWTMFYLIRFLATVITASIVTKEAGKVKCCIAGASSRHLSSEIRDELGSFLNHASTWPVKFTACDLFTVNTRLIMSAVATGTTYLVVLVQFRPQI